MKRCLVLISIFLVATAHSQEVTPPKDAKALKREILTKLRQSASQPATQHADKQMATRARELTAQGARFLLAAQEPDGGWNTDFGPGITCLVLKALALEPTVGPQHPAVLRGVERVRQFARDDGGIYSSEGLLKNYESSVALSLFAVLGKSKYQDQIVELQQFLKKHQWDESEGNSQDDPWYGGAGYGNQKRPDLSNTQIMLDALHDSGLPPDDPAYQKALIFIQRCQMLGESNDQPFAKGSAQGGFVYTPANDGESKAGEIEVAGGRELRCYGSMTYAGFKSMLYAGLEPDDPRVRAAVNWISKYWTLDHNPNMPGQYSQQGLYYYYHTFGRALAAWNQTVISDQAGKPHYWRQELVAKLARLQRRDGSWVNEADRWMEGSSALTTAYAMLSLQAAYPANTTPPSRKSPPGG
ncbi:MAG: hypothetical protein ABIG44_07390 [Planctomycetota bacterium]